MSTVSAWRCVAIMGAPGTGKSWLTRALSEVLRARGDTVHEGPPAPPTVSGPTVPNTNTVWLIADNPDGLHGQAPAASPACAQLEHKQALTPTRWPGHALTLVMGLDLPMDEPDASGLEAHRRASLDQRLRQGLLDSGQDFRVIHGLGLDRLNQALMALGLPAQDAATWAERESAQFALNAGRTPWLCEKCSDPECEHRLFTRLLSQRPSSKG